MILLYEGGRLGGGLELKFPSACASRIPFCIEIRFVHGQRCFEWFDSIKHYERKAVLKRD